MREEDSPRPSLVRGEIQLQVWHRCYVARVDHYLIHMPSFDCLEVGRLGQVRARYRIVAQADTCFGTGEKTISIEKCRTTGLNARLGVSEVESCKRNKRNERRGRAVACPVLVRLSARVLVQIHVESRHDSGEHLRP